MEIKIRAIKPKTEKSKLPSKVDREYPKSLRFYSFRKTHYSEFGNMNLLTQAMN